MQEEEKFLFHVTMVTHNSRTNERMKSLGIIAGKPVELSEQEEVNLVINFTRIVLKNNYKILNFNICKNHVHFILYCSFENLERIVGNIKSVTSKKCKKTNSTNLWAQKFNRRVISNDKHLAYFMDYIKYNRAKHDLPENLRLQRLIEKMLTHYEELFQS